MSNQYKSAGDSAELTKKWKCNRAVAQRQILKRKQVLLTDAAGSNVARTQLMDAAMPLSMDVARLLSKDVRSNLSMDLARPQLMNVGSDLLMDAARPLSMDAATSA